MTQIVLNIEDDKFSSFLELIKTLNYVSVSNYDSVSLRQMDDDKNRLEKIENTEEQTKVLILENIKAGLEELQLFNKGKLKTTSAKDFLNEL
jgi:hypothetical protein